MSTYYRVLLLVITGLLCSQSTYSQYTRKNTGNQSINRIFDNLQIAGIDPNQSFRYSYFFESKNAEFLEKLRTDRDLKNYILVNYLQFPDSNFTLHIERKEKLTRASLADRELNLIQLANKYQVYYVGFDIGVIRIFLPPLTDQRFSSPILTKKGADLFKLGFLYYKLELNKDAIETFLKCVEQEIYPDTSNLILSNLYSFFSKTKKALLHAKHAIGHNSQYVNAYYNLGVIYYELRQNGNALGELLKAEKLKPNDDEILSFIGQLYLYSGNLSRSKEYTEKALRLNPSNAKALAVQDALNK